MANRPIWNIRRRHEWLTKGGLNRRIKRRSRLRIGLEAAIQRKKKPEPAQEESGS